MNPTSLLSKQPQIQDQPEKKTKFAPPLLSAVPALSLCFNYVTPHCTIFSPFNSKSLCPNGFAGNIYTPIHAHISLLYSLLSSYPLLPTLSLLLLH